jgi:hypothetical protein
MGQIQIRLAVTIKKLEKTITVATSTLCDSYNVQPNVQQDEDLLSVAQC